MWSWQNIRTFYHNNSTSNEDFLFRLDEIPLTSYADSSLKEELKPKK